MQFPRKLGKALTFLGEYSNIVTGSNCPATFCRDAKYPSKIDLLEDKADSMTENLDNATATNELTEPIINDLDNSLTALGNSKKTHLFSPFL